MSNEEKQLAGERAEHQLCMFLVVSLVTWLVVRSLEDWFGVSKLVSFVNVSLLFGFAAGILFFGVRFVSHRRNFEPQASPGSRATLTFIAILMLAIGTCKLLFGFPPGTSPLSFSGVTHLFPGIGLLLLARNTKPSRNE